MPCSTIGATLLNADSPLLSDFSARPRFRPQPERIVSTAVVIGQNLVHYPRCSLGTLARAWTFTLALQLIDDALNKWLLDMKGIRKIEKLCAVSRFQSHGLIAENRYRQLAFAARYFNFIVVRSGSEIPRASSQGPASKAAMHGDYVFNIVEVCPLAAEPWTCVMGPRM